MLSLLGFCLLRRGRDQVCEQAPAKVMIPPWETAWGVLRWNLSASRREPSMGCCQNRCIRSRDRCDQGSWKELDSSRLQTEAHRPRFYSAAHGQRHVLAYVECPKRRARNSPCPRSVGWILGNRSRRETLKLEDFGTMLKRTISFWPAWLIRTRSY